MRYKIHDEPEYWAESIRALVRLYHNNSLANTLREIQARHGNRVELAPIAALFESLDALLARVAAAVDLTGPHAALLLKGSEGMNELIHSVFLRRRAEGRAMLSPRAAIATLIDPDDRMPEFEDDLAFFRWLDGQSIPAEVKYDAWRLLVDFEPHERWALEAIGKTTEVLRAALPAFRERMEEGMELFRRRLTAGDLTFLGDPPILHLADIDGCEIYPTLFEPNSMSLNFYDEAGIADLSIGVAFLELHEFADETGQYRRNMADFLKALADPTKLEILRMLRQRKYYAGELAAALGLTGPTISHHMGALINLLVISVEKAGNRVYYGLNAAMLRGYFTELSAMFAEEGQ